MNDRYVVAYSEYRIFVCNIQTESIQVLEIQSNIFCPILALKFRSEEEDVFKCFVAVEYIKIKNRIACFCATESRNDDFSDESDNDVMRLTLGRNEKKSVYKDICYYKDLTPDTHINISDDLKQILFANGDENFMIEMRDKCVLQSNLDFLNGKIVF